MAVVVVASVALKWFLEEEDTSHALALWDHWQRTSEPVMAPPIFRSEVTNVLHRGVRRQIFSQADAADVLGAIISMVSIREPSDLYDRALALTRSLEQEAAYDALYLALAEAEGCDMWTADRRFVRAAQDRFGSVRWIGEAP